MRQLATIRKIDNLLPIEGADLIKLAIIDGWQCVVKAEEFQIGDLCVYFEIDSLIPIVPSVEHLRERAYKKMFDKDWIRIKTIKLRGQISQGLALPLGAFFSSDLPELGADVSDVIGVEKFELPIPAELIGQIGNFPNFIPRTAQSRCQNIVSKIFIHNKDARYEVSMKMDGTSFTAFHNNGQDGVCGRNWLLEEVEKTASNKLVRTYIDSGLKEVLHNFGKNIAVQGELMGQGVPPNREQFTDTRLYVFDIYDIDKACYLLPEERLELLNQLWNAGVNAQMVRCVPILHPCSTLVDLGISTLADLLKHSEGPGLNKTIREGEVFKSMDTDFTFKVISNKYLLKEE
jgi:RNA ligase (TIGR02306 family)